MYTRHMDINPLVPELYCSNIQESLKFYCDVLGFTVAYERPEVKFAFLELEGAQLMLEELNDTDRTWKTGVLERPFGRGINIQIATSTIDSLAGTVRSNGIPFFVEPEEKWYRRATDTVGNKQFVIQDPDGYLLRFSQTVGTRPNA